MSFFKLASAVGLLAASVAQVAAHGTVQGIVIDGEWYEGYSPSFQYLSVAPVIIGWSVPEDLDNGFVAPDAYTNADIICHKGATNAQTSATVAAGGQVSLEWTAWPESHKGPVIDYLANCNGDCSTVDKTTLEFFKIDEGGLIDDSTIPGTWASDQLIANNNTWTVTIPTDIAPGNYVLRHEIIALHSAESADGAQNYPQCINLEITGSGTATPSGVLGTALYTETDPGIEVNIYQSLSTYVIPGPTLYSGAASETQTQIATPTGAAVVNSASTTAAIVSATASSDPSATSSAVTAAVTSATSAAASSNTAATSVTVTSATSTAAVSANLAVTSSASNTPNVEVFPSSSASTTSDAPSSKLSGFPAPFSNSSSTFSSVVVPTTTPAFIAIPTTDVATASAATGAPHTFSSETGRPTHLPKPPTTPKFAVSHTSSYAAPSSTSTIDPVTSDAMPAGTTFADLLAWLNTIVHEIAAGNKSLLGRRHARDLTIKH